MDVSAAGALSPAIRTPERPQEAALDQSRASTDSVIERREAAETADTRREERQARTEDRLQQQADSDRRRADANEGRVVDIRV